MPSPAQASNSPEKPGNAARSPRFPQYTCPVGVPTVRGSPPERGRPPGSACGCAGRQRPDVPLVGTVEVAGIGQQSGNFDCDASTGSAAGAGDDESECWARCSTRRPRFPGAAPESESATNGSHQPRHGPPEPAIGSSSLRGGRFGLPTIPDGSKLKWPAQACPAAWGPASRGPIGPPRGDRLSPEAVQAILERHRDCPGEPQEDGIEVIQPLCGTEQFSPQLSSPAWSLHP